MKPIFNNSSYDPDFNLNFSITDSTNNPQNGIVVYPNPTNSITTISNLPVGSNLIQLYNTYGQLLYSIYCFTTQTDIDLSGYPVGVYFFKISNMDKQKTIKVIKQ